MSDLITGLVALLAAIPSAVAGAEEADRDRILRALDQARTGLAAIGPNAPTIRAAVERRLAEIHGAHEAPWGTFASDAKDPNFGRTCICGAAIRAGGRYEHICRREAERGDEPTREIPSR